MTPAAPRPQPWLSLFAWLLPSCSFKYWVLRRLGNVVGVGVNIGPNLVLNCGKFTIADGVWIMPFNMFKHLARVELGEQVLIGRFNQFSAGSGYQQFSDKVGLLRVGAMSLFTNRHYVDCSGQVIVGYHAAIGGIRTIIQSHEFDLVEDATTVGRVTISDYSMTGGCCLLLKDAVVPPYSVLAAGTVLSRTREGADARRGLYGGVPAKFLRELPDLKWWKRDGFVHNPARPFDDSALELD